MHHSIKWYGTRLTLMLALVLALTLGVIPGVVHADGHGCDLDTLHGTYLFQAVGTISDGVSALPYAEAGSFEMDGAGNGAGVFSAGLNGETIADREVFDVTYELISGCAFAAYAPIGDELFEFHFYTSPSGEMIAYYADGFSGTMWRQHAVDSNDQSDHDDATAEAIASARSAAPASVSDDATVWAWPTEDNPDFTELVAGSNGWTCVPDDPATPGPDPMCLDDQWVEWLLAIMEGRDPEITDWGWSYMLQGGIGASDADPAQMEPAEGEDWLIAPPHLMLIGPEPFDTAAFPDHRDSGAPYIMWGGTPYEHFMIPVQFDIPTDPDDPIASALSAAPDTISAEAAVWAWPEGDEPVFEELRAGANGWVCLPDDPITPGHDPMCLDDQWMEWLTAQFEGREPELTTVGWAYMLQGGSGASDADPTQMEPLEGEDWLSGPPHVMMIAPGDFDTSTFPDSRDSGEPYIMWGGTPYEHFMAPSALDWE